jgi:hypothetical protein
MRLLLRILGWATLLVVPCWLVSPHYQKVLARAATVTMAAVGIPWSLRTVEIFAPCDLGIFMAMVLASTSAPRRARALALLKGIPVLFVLEVITAVLVCIQITLKQPPQTAAKDQIRTFLKYLIDSALLWSPLLVWLTLLGRWELPALGGRRDEARAARRGAGAERTPRRPPAALHR